MTTYTDVFTGDVIVASEVSYEALSLTTSQTLTWPVPRILDVTGATGATTVTLPDATLASVGQDILFNNLSANSFVIYKSGTTTVVATCAAGTATYVYMTDNSTVAGTWRATVMATSGSAATAADLQGYGVRAISTDATHLSAAITQSDWNSAARTTLLSDRASLINYIYSTAGALTLDNTAAESNYFFWFRNSATNSVTVTPSSGTVDGAATKTIAAGESCAFAFNGTNWYTLGYGRSTTSSYTASNISLTGKSGTLALNTSNFATYTTGSTLVTFSGTMSANVTVTFPATANVWFLYNNATMAGFTLTVKTAAGSVTYSLSAGERLPLFADGNDLLTAPSPTTIEAENFATAMAVALG